MNRSPVLILCVLLTGPALAATPPHSPTPDPSAESHATAIAALQAKLEAEADARAAAEARATALQAQVQRQQTSVGVAVQDGPTTQLVRVADGPVDQTVRTSTETEVHLSEPVAIEESLDVLTEGIDIQGDQVHYEASTFPASTAYASLGSECFNTYGAQGEKFGLTLSRVPKICKHAMASGLWVAMAELIATACTEGQACADQLDHAMNRAFSHLEAISDRLDVTDE